MKYTKSKVCSILLIPASGKALMPAAGLVLTWQQSLHGRVYASNSVPSGTAWETTCEPCSAPCLLHPTVPSLTVGQEPFRSFHTFLVRDKQREEERFCCTSIARGANALDVLLSSRGVREAFITP